MALQSEISKAFWCIIRNGRAEFEEAQISIGAEKSRYISWFDELLRGELTLQGEDPLTLLITGPPGSGKTIFALELCYRLAKTRRLFSLSISTDAETNQIIENAKSLGWKDAVDLILPFKGRPPDNPNRVAVWGVDKIEKWETLSQIVETALEALGKWLSKLPERMKEKFGSIVRWSPTREKIEKVSPNILVVDSLNIIEPKERGEFFQQFLKAAKKTNGAEKIIIFVLDSGAQDKEHKFWEYVCDIVIRLDYTHLYDYYIRTIEIVKARYQEHVWGKHQLKIYPRFKMPEESDPEYNQKIRRAHPYRKEGGVFIFPSIHYYLSVYKRKAPTQSPQLADTCPDKLNEILEDPKTSEKGLPEGRCTAFIGVRGGHKSHLGYLHLLNRIINRDENGLVISLRDDEEMTKKTMEGILKQEFPDERRTLSDFEYKNRLEILYYPPGYITPEDFLHRMFISIQRLTQKEPGGNEKTKLTVLFNSLDQLSARFPLCVKQEIFVPGIIELLSGEGITSIFIAVEEPGQPAEQYGLLPMGDLILSFHLYRFKFEDYYGHLKETWKFVEGKANRICEESKGTYGDEIVLQVVRFAGGQRAGAKGLLELVDENKVHESLYPNGAGLYFTRLSPKFSQGEFVRKREKGEG